MGIWLHVETWMQCLFKDSDTGGTIAGKLTVIKFGGLPLKCVLLILTSYNLMDWLSLLLFSYC